MEKKYYIAFSIHGTNTFITAETNQPGVIRHWMPQMTEVKSRRPDYKEEDGVKLHWRRLMTEAGQPLRSPPMILALFNLLEKDGWVIDKKAFVEKHYAKFRNTTVSG